MDPTRRFSNRVADYIRFRPRYPDGLIPLLQKEIGLDRSWAIADVGSGTGISSEPFLAFGNTVFGVEPNDEMRQAAESVLKTFANFRSINGAAEATTLPSQSVNAVIAGQAFHWFNAEKSRAEFARILKPGGWVVLIWNRRHIDTSPFLRDYEALLNTHGIDYDKIRHDHIDAATIAGIFATGHQYRVLANEQVFDFAGLRGRLLSCSYVPAEGQPGFAPMLADLQRIFDKHHDAQRVRFEYDTDVYFGKV
jgi:SAM-dependent methyltransferase